jgi:hypothetical protein
MAKKLWIENVELPAASYSETAPDESWVDKSGDAVAWEKYGEQVLDYIFVLPKIVSILIIKANPSYPTIDFSGWGNLTQEEKETFCRTVLYVPYALRMSVFSDEQDIEHAKLLLIKTYGIDDGYLKGQYKGRRGIVERMRQHVFLNYVRKDLLSLDVSKDFGKDTATHLFNYERFSHNDFINWLTNKAGTPFENDGFAQKSYYTEQLKTELLTIYSGE